MVIAGGEKVAAQTTGTREVSPHSPNVLFIITDQLRFDTIHALGNTNIYTPNLDRLARRGVAFVNAYSQCPVCVPARYTIRTGCESRMTRVFENGWPQVQPGEPKEMTNRCGPYLATVMKQLGYRTFGIGKFHTLPWDEPLGYEVQLYSEELYGADQRRRDAYAAWIAKEHPAFDYLEGLMGERAEMYYEPQRSPLPAALTIETWAADQAAKRLESRMAGRISDWFHLSDRIRRSRHRFLSTVCMTRTACPTQFVATRQPTTWMNRFRG